MCLGVPRQVVGTVDDRPVAIVDVDGSRQEVSTDMLGAVGLGAGDWVVVHLGFAMELIDEQEARAVLGDLQQLDDWYAAELGRDSA